MLKWWKAGVAATAAAFFLAACGGGSSNPGNLAQVAERNGFTALLAAVEKADLGGALTAPNANLTVFAPTDAAFTELATTLGFASAGAMVEALPADVLADVLLYHVVGVRATAADLVAAGPDTLDTLYEFEGAPATFSYDTASGVVLTDHLLTEATVTTPNVNANNGIIHVIDKVLVPPGIFNIVQMAQLNPLFSELVAAVVAVNELPSPTVLETLSGDGPFTVFAPVNSAFEAIADVTATLDAAVIADVLRYHVLTDEFLAADVIALAPATVPTALGMASLDIAVVGGQVELTDLAGGTSTVLVTDVRASNGVIHVIDRVLLPLAP